MGNMRREMLIEIEKELDHWPNVDWEIERRTKHWRLHLAYAGRKQFIIMSSSPSDYRGIKNKISDIRKIAVTLGAKRDS